MRQNLGFSLPGTSTIHVLLKVYNFKIGVSTNLTGKLTSKVAGMTDGEWQNIEGFQASIPVGELLMLPIMLYYSI